MCSEDHTAPQQVAMVKKSEAVMVVFEAKIAELETGRECTSIYVLWR